MVTAPYCILPLMTFVSRALYDMQWMGRETMGWRRCGRSQAKLPSPCQAMISSLAPTCWLAAPCRICHPIARWPSLLAAPRTGRLRAIGAVFAVGAAAQLSPILIIGPRGVRHLDNPCRPVHGFSQSQGWVALITVSDGPVAACSCLSVAPVLMCVAKCKL